MKYKMNNQNFFCDITDGIAILIEIDTGIYYGLNDLTTNIFENIIAGVDVEKVLDSLKIIKGFNAETEKKFTSFLDELLKSGFIIEANDENGELNINIDEFKNDEKDFVISEYRDVSELLLADPIHQVKEDEGWKPNM